MAVTKAGAVITGTRGPPVELIGMARVPGSAEVPAALVTTQVKPIDPVAPAVNVMLVLVLPAVIVPLVIVHRVVQPDWTEMEAV